MTWKDYPEQTHPELTRWIENDKGDIISVVTANTKGILNIDGELRCSIGTECFTIPCTLSVVEKMPLSQVVKVATKRYELIINNGGKTNDNDKNRVV